MSNSLSVIMVVGLLAVWVVYLFEGRRLMQIRGQLSNAFILQLNILPPLVAFELLVSPNPLAVAVVALLFFFVCWPFARYLMVAVPLVTGWHIGMMLYAETSWLDWRALLVASTLAALFACLAVLIRFAVTLRISPQAELPPAFYLSTLQTSSSPQTKKAAHL